MDSPKQIIHIAFSPGPTRKSPILGSGPTPNKNADEVVHHCEPSVIKPRVPKSAKKIPYIVLQASPCNAKIRCRNGHQALSGSGLVGREVAGGVAKEEDDCCVDCIWDCCFRRCGSADAASEAARLWRRCFSLPPPAFCFVYLWRLRFPSRFSTLGARDGNGAELSLLTIESGVEAKKRVLLICSTEGIIA